LRHGVRRQARALAVDEGDVALERRRAELDRAVVQHAAAAPPLRGADALASVPGEIERVEWWKHMPVSGRSEASALAPRCTASTPNSASAAAISACTRS
jgi:hypothetical protein